MNEFKSESPIENNGPEKYFGKYPGLVLDNNPSGSSDQAHTGELLVEVSGILEEEPQGEGERPIQVLAKPCFLPGFFFIPEKGTQIWVEFAAGDINIPIWSGVWYPQDAVPKNAEGKDPTPSQKIIRTGDNLIQFIDGDGIRIETKHYALVMDSKGIRVTDGTGNKESLQLLVVEKIIEWLLSHNHTGNLGGAAPMFPKDLVDLQKQILAGEIKSGKDV